ncbi:MAG: GTPase HflX [Chloroflexi bacterium]|nr:GTPase HflX [Chloroflexota bacterium]
MRPPLLPTRAGPRRAVLVGLEVARQRTLWALGASLDELAALAATGGFTVVDRIAQRVRRVNPAHYLGRGKVEELKALVAATDAEAVIVDDELGPSQQRELEQAVGREVIDRTEVILGIFGQHARTSEGRLQVELAQLEYLLPRLRRRWTHLERQMGGIGGRAGLGETQLEVDRRLVRERIAELRAELERVRQHRGVQRARRQKADLPVVALVGYTNAGKSTLFNALTAAGVLAADHLFATLDPTVRRLALPNGQEALLSDTVGFIQKLPATVVSAFRATLEELDDAAILVHVLDVTHPQAYEQSRTVTDTLAELGLADKPLITALNKIDRALPGPLEMPGDGVSSAGLDAEIAATLRGLCEAFPNGVAVAAVHGWGLATLRGRIAEVLRQDWVDVDVEVPYARGDLLALVHERGSVRAERFSAAGARIRGRVPPTLAARLAPYRR